jgi:nucleoid-associated protein
MLKLKTGTGIDKTTLELNSTISFDIQHLHEAARIDIGKWQNNEQPYLSFIKKSGRQDDVTRYFRNALSCTDYIDSKHHTTQLLKAVDSYCLFNEWSAEQKQNARRRTYEYCNEKYALGEPVNVTALSAMINDQEPSSFSSYILENQIALNETFSPHKATFNRFKRIQGRFNNIKISFDVDDVINETVDYDPASNSLIIRGIPESLIIDINKAKGNEPTTE